MSLRDKYRILENFCFIKEKEINWNRYTYSINHDFFKIWNAHMAYILGFSAADGNVYKTTLAWDLTNKIFENKILLKKFNKVMHSNYPITKRKKSFRLRISNKTIVENIKKLGIIPNKKKVLQMPDVPEKFLRDFIRGFLDGDGWITIRSRSNNSNEISLGFSNGSLYFMNSLTKILSKELSIKNYHVRKRVKTTPNKIITTTYSLEFYCGNAYKILSYLYYPHCLCLQSKYKKYLLAKEIYEEILEIKKKGRSWIYLEKTKDINMKEFLYQQLIIEKKLPKEIALSLDISLSTIYRWLDKTSIRRIKSKNDKIKSRTPS